MTRPLLMNFHGGGDVQAETPLHLVHHQVIIRLTEKQLSELRTVMTANNNLVMDEMQRRLSLNISAPVEVHQ